MIDFDALLANANIAAFLRVVREGETNQTDDAYRMIVGGGMFDSFADHPRVRVWIQRLNIYSTAAGCYQFLQATWSDLKERYGFTDFSPRSQDCGAVALLNDYHALEDVLAGRLSAAITKSNRIWASLPGSPYGQGGISAQRARAVYLAWGGVEAESEATIATGPAAPATGPSRPVSEDISMPAPLALIGPILSVITELIPALSTLFGKNAEKYKDKITAATQVVDIVTKATGAVNAQEAVEKIQTDPTALQAAKAAVMADPAIEAMLTEVGGGIGAAWQRSTDPAQLPLWRNGAFWISLLFTLLLWFAAVVVLLIDKSISNDIKVQVIQAIIGLTTVVGGFWLGSSFGSGRKTEMLNEARK